MSACCGQHHWAQGAHLIIVEINLTKMISMVSIFLIGLVDLNDPDGLGGLNGLDGLDGPGGYYINGSCLKALDV